jgi:hypothetical protein
MIEDNTNALNKNSIVAKGISRLENIGKRGKLTKFIKITFEHFEFLK